MTASILAATLPFPPAPGDAVASGTAALAAAVPSSRSFPRTRNSRNPRPRRAWS